ncbi:MAG: glycine--tRNA ligase subunit beta [Myxococcales bacterium]|nr:glycine--tRNA ligase subunit beta [Myxococcales bacterium]
MTQHVPFLLEIGTEEIPARMASGGIALLRDRLVSELETLQISAIGVRTAVTPRRLVITIDQMGIQQPDRTEEFVGPSVASSFKDGLPTKAAEGFARGKGVDVSDLYTIETPKGPYIAARKHIPGSPTLVVLQAVLPRVITSIIWPKSMRWGRHKETFVRPIHWLVALLGADIIPFTYIGVTSGRVTYGHRFLSAGGKSLEHASQYYSTMAQNYVMVSPEERRSAIESGVFRLAEEAGGSVIADPGLTDEVQHLVEWPVPTLGTFPETFAQLPREVLISSMRSHQRYFAVQRKNSDVLSNHFVFISNMVTDDMSVVARGNERVLAARLSDARFFYQEDTRRPLETYLSSLDDRIFLAGLGTVREKTERLRVIARGLARLCAPEAAEIADRGALLSKADLGTRVVGEFPDLQGIMGRHYAQLGGESPDVATAIEEHYRPRFAGDTPPQTVPGALVAIADRLDTLVGRFGIGLIPTGNQDPYALRRGTLGLIHTLTTHKWHMSLGAMVALAVDAYGTLLQRTRSEVLLEIDSFVRGRIRNLMANDHPVDVIEAVLATPDDIVTHLMSKVESLDALRQMSDFEPLAITFKRVMNITKDHPTAPCIINPTVFEDAAEHTLFDQVTEVNKVVVDLLANLRFTETLTILTTLKAPVDRFFDSVMVMSPDHRVRNNRISLLVAIRDMFTKIADFSRIST